MKIKKGKIGIKAFSLFIFIVFYIISFYTCNFPYPEYAKYPTISFLASLLTVIAFLFVTAVFSYSKKFLILISTYFTCVFVGTTAAIILDGFSFSWFTLPVSLIILSFGIAVQHFEFAIIDLFNILHINVSYDYGFYIIFIFVIGTVYSVYFVCRQKRKDEMK